MSTTQHLDEPQAARPRRLTHSITALAAAIALGAGGLTLAALEQAPAPALAAGPGMTIDPNDQQSVKDAFQYWYQPAITVPAGWTGNTSTCNAGAVSAAAQQATLSAVNYFRTMAGLDPVTENTAFSAKAQQAALMMYAKGQLSHNPTADWPCYSADGADAASHSNLSLGWGGPYFGAAAVAGQVEDTGESNVPIVGHRRWILKPDLGVVGMGSTTYSNSLYVIHSQTNSSATKPGWIPWPSAGYFPAELLASDQSWSMSSSLPANFAAATVSMTKNGSPVTTSTYPVQNGYGPNSLVWSVSGYSAPAPGQVDTYHVTIGGVQSGAAASYSYDVKVFAAAPTTPLSANVEVTGTLAVGNTAQCQVSGWNYAPDQVSYQWYGSAPAGADYTLRAIPGATSASYRISAADLGRNWLSCTVTGSKSGYKSFTSGALDFARWGPIKPGTLSVPAATVTGTAKVGGTLTANPGTWGSGVTLTYQWLRGGAAISGATAKTYQAQAADGGATLSVKVTGTLTGYNAATATSPGVKVALATFTAPAVSYTGTVKVGSTLTAVPGTWGSGVTVKYQWLRSGAAISGATAKTYKAQAADKGKALAVKVTASKTGYATASKTSGAKTVAAGTFTASVPTISGTLAKGKKLTANKGTWSPAPTVKYQWYRNGKAISKATGATYVLTTADRGQKISVKVTGSKSGYATLSKTSASRTVKK